MYRLVYVSTASESLQRDQIASILDVSQSNNHERFITGFLAYNRGSFMQALEGDEQEVRELYARIRHDPRHTGIVQIVGEPIFTRAFPDWAMNYYRVDDRVGAVSMVVRRDDPVDALLPSTMPRDLLYLFTRFLNIS